MIYLKKFDTVTEYNAYTADTANFVTPNVSLIEETHGVAYHPAEPTPTETRVVATFNVTSTSHPTNICYDVNYTTCFSAIEIDGVQLPNVVSAYTFDTLGEHTVKYTLADQTSIDDYAFRSCDSLTSINIPNGVINIGSFTFCWCDNLTTITIPNSVTSIGESAFNSCYSLTSIEIPSGVTSIDDYAFCKCESLDTTSKNAISAINPTALECEEEDDDEE